MEFGLDLYSLSIIGLGLALGAFVKGLTGMGLPADRVGLTSTTSAEAGASEVHIYVR